MMVVVVVVAAAVAVIAAAAAATKARAAAAAAAAATASVTIDATACYHLCTRGQCVGNEHFRVIRHFPNRPCVLAYMMLEGLRLDPSTPIS